MKVCHFNIKDIKTKEDKTLCLGNETIKEKTKYYFLCVRNIVKETEKAVLLETWAPSPYVCPFEIWMPKKSIYFEQSYYEPSQQYSQLKMYLNDKAGDIIINKLQSIYDKNEFGYNAKSILSL